MAVNTLKTGLPADLDLDGGYTIRVDAIDPTTAGTVAGITVSNVVITARNLVTGQIEQIFPLGPAPLFAYASESTASTGPLPPLRTG